MFETLTTKSQKHEETKYFSFVSPELCAFVVKTEPFKVAS